MPFLISRNNVADAWESLLYSLISFGNEVTTRNLKHYELTNVVYYIEDARNNLLIHPKRNLQYRFAVAEWLWVWFGHNDVNTIALYNPNISKFSDNGRTFKGAYGPRITDQWEYIYTTLLKDRASRQAVLTIFVPNPEASKDIPCTISVQFLIREEKLHTIVSMRSSDIWLGLPYDTFTFSMIGNILAAELDIDVGSICFHLGSSHLYDIDFNKAEEIIFSDIKATFFRAQKLNDSPPKWLNTTLELQATSNDYYFNGHCWDMYKNVLIAKNNKEAMNALWEVL